MKKLSLLLLSLAMAIIALFYSCSSNKSDSSKEKELPSDTAIVRTVSANGLVVNGQLNGHGYVDLGLSVKWATENVGADSPTDYGSFFCWGETKPKERYLPDNCLTLEKTMGPIGGDAEYDAACANWGGSWRMPSANEFSELLENCTQEWVDMEGVPGYLLTSKINSNKVFLPAAGLYDRSGHVRIHYGGYYWTATPGSDVDAKSFCFWKLHSSKNSYRRGFGLSVRAVTE